MKKSIILLFFITFVIFYFGSEFIVENSRGVKTLYKYEVNLKEDFEKHQYVTLLNNLNKSMLNITYSKKVKFNDNHIPTTIEFNIKNQEEYLNYLYIRIEDKFLITKNVNGQISPSKIEKRNFKPRVWLSNKAKQKKDFTFIDLDVMSQQETEYKYTFEGTKKLKTEEKIMETLKYTVQVFGQKGTSYFTKNGEEIKSTISGTDLYNLKYFPSKYEKKQNNFEKYPITPYLFGNNFWNELKQISSAKGITKFLGIDMIRIGGIYRDKNPLFEPSLKNYKEFIDYTKAEPFVQLSYISGEDVLTQMKRIKSILPNLKYISLSNENNIAKDIYNKNTSIDEFNEKWRGKIEKIKSKYPDIKIVGPDFTIKSLPQYDTWLTNFLEENGDLVDIVSIHRYPFEGSTSRRKIYRDINQFDSYINQIKTLLHKKDMGDKKIAITETNVNWNFQAEGAGDASSSSAAIWLASNFITSIKEGLWSFQHWCLYNDGTLSIVNSEGGVPELRPVAKAYFHFKDVGKSYIKTTNLVEDTKILISYNKNLKSYVTVFVNYSQEKKSINIDTNDNKIEIKEGSDFYFMPYSINTIYFDEDFNKIKINSYNPPQEF